MSLVRIAMLALHALLERLINKLLEQKSENKLRSSLKNVAAFLLFALGIFIAYLRFTRT